MFPKKFVGDSIWTHCWSNRKFPARALLAPRSISTSSENISARLQESNTEKTTVNHTMIQHGKKEHLNNFWYAEKNINFYLNESFISSYADRKVPFGFNGLGELVYKRTYARTKSNGELEDWRETIQRVVEGTFSIRKRWSIVFLNHPWNEEQEQELAQRMFEKMFCMKFLPPGRGLWAMGSPLTNEKYLFASLHNCAFVSTRDMYDENSRPSDPFAFLMDASMLGVGVGFDVLGASAENRVPVKQPDPQKTKVFRIPDSREGWVESVVLLIDSYMVQGCDETITFDYSGIRPVGSRIKGFGGTASGPDPLSELHKVLRSLFDEAVGRYLGITDIVDIMNLIGKCVVSGNVRRTAEIAFGCPDSEEYINLKNYTINKHRAAYGWTSNNSVICPVGRNFTGPASKGLIKRIVENGEPGFFWLENAQRYGRMIDPDNNLDRKACGGNPCLEQTLESYELCCLVETFPDKHEKLEDYLDTLELAFLYAKTVMLPPTHWKKTNEVLSRNRRIGTSMSGIAQFVSKRGMAVLKNWCCAGYEFLCQVDKRISSQYKIPISLKKSTIKPSGTVSLLVGATPGMHYPEGRFCIRRIRISKTSPLISQLKVQGYVVEDCVGSENTTSVVEFPIDMGQGQKIRATAEVSMWEQLELAAFLQAYWSDNQVSCTVTFCPNSEASSIAHALDIYQFRLKGVSFLPRMSYGAYPQMPFECISQQEYEKRVALLKRPDDTQFNPNSEDLEPEMYCTTDKCEIKSFIGQSSN